MSETSDLPDDLYDKVLRLLRDSLRRVVQRTEFARELETEVLEPERLVEDVAADRSLIDRAMAEYKTVLSVRRRQEAHRSQRPAWWDRTWRPGYAAASWWLGLVLTVAGCGWTLTSLGTFGSGAPWVALVTLAVVVAGVRGFVRKGLPPTVSARCAWWAAGVHMSWARVDRQIAWRRTIRDEVVHSYVREWINRHAKPSYSTVLKVRDASGLGTLGAQEHLVETESIKRFRRELRRRPATAIGVAGPRGVGKTTIFQHALGNVLTPAGAPPYLPVSVAAPARYDARDFILHVYAVTCRAVLAFFATAGREPLASSDGERLWRRVRTRHIALRQIRYVAGRLVTSVVVLGNGLVITQLPFGFSPAAFLHGRFVQEPFRAAPAHAIPGAAPTTLFVSVAGICLMAFAVLRVVWLAGWAGYHAGGALFRWWRASRRNLVRRGVDHRALRALARHELRRIRYLQTRTSGWSGKISGGSLLEFAPARSVALAERPVTHPEIVDDYRRFVERVLAVLCPADIGGVVVAIDELDKLSDPGQAQDFINEIKGLFGVAGCRFLVSVSEDALVSFHRSGVPVRDAFDSAFTTVVPIDPFTLDESRQWLARRAIGIPESFVCLCHCLSAGLPRDLERVAIRMYDLARSPAYGPPSLAVVVEQLVRGELVTRFRALTTAISQFDTREDSIDLLNLLSWADADVRPAAMLELSLRLAPPDAGVRPEGLHRFRWEAAGLLYWYATLIEVFGNGLDAAGLWSLTHEPGGIGSLVEARRQLAVDPRLSWQVIDHVRGHRGRAR